MPKTGRLGRKRYENFMRETKREGHTHKEALRIYQFYKATIQDVPKRGDFKRYHHLVKEALTSPPPVRKGKVLKFPPVGAGAGAGAGGGAGGASPAGAGGDWWEQSEFEQDAEEQDQDPYAA
jgi:hypothetical protein